MTDMTQGTPGPEEKVCPYCAEVIKAAAIKCRYCQSDLPEPEAEAGHESEAEPDPEPDLEPGDVEAVEKTALAGARPTFPVFSALSRQPDRVVAALAGLCGVLVLVLIAGIVFLFVTARPGDLPTASNGQVTDTEFRSAAMSAAAADATAVLSYSYKTLEEDQEAARDTLTAKFAKEYDSVMADAGKKATAAKLTQKASVLTSSLLSITSTRATALLYVNTITTAEGSKRQQLLQNRVKITLERKDGDWAVSNMVRF